MNIAIMVSWLYEMSMFDGTDLNDDTWCLSRILLCIYVLFWLTNSFKNRWNRRNDEISWWYIHLSTHWLWSDQVRQLWIVNRLWILTTYLLSLDYIDDCSVPMWRDLNDDAWCPSRFLLFVYDMFWHIGSFKNLRNQS